MISVLGFNLNRESSCVYRIEASQYLSVTEAVRRFTGGCPIFSQNRLEGNLHFTVVPYAKPADFELAKCPLKRACPEEIIAQVIPGHKEGDLYIEDEKFSMAQLTEMKNDMIKACNRPSSLLVDFVDTIKTPGRALDLGCGIGANSLIMLKKGWDVIAIDKSSIAIEGYLKTCKSVSEKFSCTKADIVKVDLPGRMNLILAVDVLPYISETEVSPLLSKIYAALHPGGRFIGSMFIYSDKENPIVSLGRGFGAHYYQGESAPAALLQHAGFQIERCSLRYDINTAPVCVEFEATR